MPQLKTRKLFISHSWNYDEHYYQLVNWLNEAPNFQWHNYSVPRDDSCDEVTNKGLTDCILKQMRPAQCIVILAGMYASHSKWIEFEIDEAVRMGKTIIGVKPWGQERIPQKIQDNATIMVGWNQNSVVDAIRNWS